jgi:hypothetical protein
MNWWQVIKLVLSAGLFVKALFAWALVFSLFHDWRSIGVVGIWFSLMIWQGLCVRYFTPEIKL